MNDNDLDKLKAAMRAATPAPDGAKKAANLALARENFDLVQGTADALRQTPDSPETGMVRRIMMMLNFLSNRAALTAATAIAAVGVLVILPISDALNPPQVSVSREALVREQMEERLAQADATMRASSEPVESRQRAYSPPNQLRESDILLDAADEITVKNQIINLDWPSAEGSTEEFANAEESSVKVASENPVSTFSIDVDTASYSVVRSSLMNGNLPPAEAVRVEEMINYFPYSHPAPEGDLPFRPTVSVFPTPWNTDTKLLQIAIQGALPEVENSPPLNLVFLIDTSGSMDQASKLPLLKQSFRLLLGQLRPEDEVAIVTYAGSAGRVLDPTPALNRDAILTVLDRLLAGGSTAGHCAGNDRRRRGDTGRPRYRRRLQRGAVRPRGAEEIHQKAGQVRHLPVSSGIRPRQSGRCNDAGAGAARQWHGGVYRHSGRGTEGPCGSVVGRALPDCR